MTHASGTVEDRETVVQEFDPLQAAAPLPHRQTFFPYGFPVRIKTNDKDVIAAAELIWGSYGQRFTRSAIELRIIVSGGLSLQQPSDPVFRAQGHLLTLVSDANNYGTCDLASGFGFASITRATLIHSEFFRYHFLEGMVYSLLDTQWLATVHAACVEFESCGVLLLGDSGAGKSSLAYACCRRGWTYVSDDASSLVLGAEGRAVVGNPRTFRFRPSVAHLFPELQRHVGNRNGKPTMEVKTADLPALKVAHGCEIEYVVFLKRNGSNSQISSLKEVSRGERLSRLSQNPWPPEMPIQQHRRAAIERLADAPGYELTYQDFDSAIDVMEQLILENKTRENENREGNNRD